MHYITCTHCKHPNLFKTEYLTFCENCGKKLLHNFPDWKQKNPGKNIDDFKQMVCTTGQENPASNATTVKKPVKINRKAVVAGIIIIVISSVMITAYIMGPELYKKVSGYVMDSPLFQEKWEKHTYGDYGLVLETPALMKESPVEIPPEAQALIERMSMFEYLAPEGLKLDAGNIRYRPESGGANIRSAADMAIANLKVQPGLANIDFSEVPFGKSGIAGVRLDGTATENGTDMAMIIVICCKDLNMWQLSITYPASSENMKHDAERIIKSMSIDYNPNLKAI